MKHIKICHDIPMFEANAEAEIDEVFASVIWDLCGHRPAPQPRPKRVNQ
jgi:hypothetical protein